MIRQIFLLLLMCMATLTATAHEVALGHDLYVDIPDGYTERDAVGGARCWDADSGMLVIAVAPDTAKYDLDKCLEHYDRIALPLDGYLTYDHHPEPFLAWREDYVDRYYYHTGDKTRLTTRTAYAGGIPYVIGYVHTAETSDAPLARIAGSVSYRGGYFSRLGTLMSRSISIILWLPLVLCALVFVLEIFMPKWIPLTALGLTLGVAGLPLWSEWDTAMAVYLLWAVMLTLVAALDIHQFNDVVSAADRAIS